jgi:hypothetical protein
MVGIARRRSSTSVLVIPRSKMSLVEAFLGAGGHGRAQAPWSAMGAHLEWEGRGGGRRGGGWGGTMGEAIGGARCRSCVVLYSVMCYMRKKTTGAKEKRRERKEKKNGRKTRKGKK